eukprot:CAMPEP_0198201702 /NCGR_PEP_ID=MMETSP1445-20131203/4677_1 /TAXON_ID=36898 /ORGANISM="Pyramimonas sp., Strain CCMP2087" /LENGTH=87 /DNA_ID=CAMNT_0043872245 /DNA_START=523 /DNA_END=786 /DNA_ORIENTATION=+
MVKRKAARYGRRLRTDFHSIQCAFVYPHRSGLPRMVGRQFTRKPPSGTCGSFRAKGLPGLQSFSPAINLFLDLCDVEFLVCATVLMV